MGCVAAAHAQQVLPSQSIEPPTRTIPTVKAAPACPKASDIDTADLYGQWQVQAFNEALPPNAPPLNPPQWSGVLELAKHPEYEGNLRGRFAIKQGTPKGVTATTLQVAGDWEDEELVLDESDDGLRVSAVWVLFPTADGCGRTWRGNRRAALSDTVQTLLVRRASSW